MLLIPCPYCGPRNENEFLHGGEADRRRPEQPNNSNDEEWTDYLYNSSNIKGWVRERWWHKHGCNRWFELERNTANHAVRQLEFE